jgi:hypothetical protein
MARTLALVVVLLAATVLYGQSPEELPKRGQLPSIADIMQESHKCSTSYLRQISMELRKENSEEIQWSVVAAKSKGLIAAGKMLALNVPPNGSPSNWEKRTTLYVANAVLMHDAAERMSKEDVSYHMRKLGQMCASCHREHR